MLFNNDQPNYSSFYDENRHVINAITDRVSKQADFYPAYIDQISDEVIVDKLGRKFTKGYFEKFRSELDEDKQFLFDLCKPDEDVRSALKAEFDASILTRSKIDKVLEMEKYSRCMEYAGYNIYGDVSKVGSTARHSLKDEIGEKFYMNTLFKKKVFNIDDLVYVSFYYDNYEYGSAQTWSPSVLDITDTRSYIVEFDALLIRYAASLPESEFKTLLDSISVMVSDKLYRLHAGETRFAKMLKTYIPFNCSKSNRGHVNIEEIRINPKIIYFAVLIAKVYCDSANGLKSRNDSKTMDSILDLADLAIRNSGSVQALGKASAAIFNYLNRVKVKGRYLESYLDTIVEYVEQKKGTMISELNRTGKFSYSVNPRALHQYINKNVNYSGMESIRATALEHIYQYSDMIYRLEDQGPAKYFLSGMESSKIEDIQKKSRAELLKLLTERERTRYIKFESEVTRYRSDAINAKDESRKNTLLVRSSGIGKIIAIEMKGSRSEVYTELLVNLEDTRYTIDIELSSRDFNRERNTRMYGQVLPSGEWDY